MKQELKSITYVKHDDQEPEQRPLDLGLIRRVFDFVKPYALTRNALIVLVILRAALLPAIAWSIGAVLGGPISKLDVTGIMLGALGYGVLTFFTQLLFKFRVLLALHLGEKVVHDMRQAMFAHLQQMTMRFYNKTKLGRTISRFTSDAESVRVGVQDVLFVSLVQSGQMIGAALIMLWFDWVLFLIIAGMAPILWALNRYFRFRLSRAFRAVQESFSRVTSTMAESVKGIRVTQGFDRQEMNSGIFKELVVDHADYNLAVAKESGTFLPLLETNSQLFTALLILIGGWRVLHRGHRSAGRRRDQKRSLRPRGMVESSTIHPLP